MFLKELISIMLLLASFTTLGVNDSQLPGTPKAADLFFLPSEYALRPIEPLWSSDDRK